MIYYPTQAITVNDIERIRDSLSGRAAAFLLLSLLLLLPMTLLPLGS